MVVKISGKLVEKSLSGIVVDVGGIGFSIAVPISTFEKLGAVGEHVTLVTYLHVREDILDLYGFSTKDERELFTRLLKVNGVGPKLALAVLSRFGPAELEHVVLNADVRRLCTVSGIGRKTAERLLIDLKDRVKGLSLSAAGIMPAEMSVTTESIRALEVLGFSTAKADDAVRIARGKLSESAAVEDIVKQALKG